MSYAGSQFAVFFLVVLIARWVLQRCRERLTV